MIYVTGDTHGHIDFAKLKIFADEKKSLTRGDYVIIAGDFGGVWDPEKLEDDLKYYKELPFTVLFVDGNHENFDMLEKYPVTEWKGGKVHIIAENIIHLMRGQVYEIDGKTFFTFGGATSTDRYLRREGIDWWPQEVPTDADVVEANKNLAKVDFKVDYIITHACDKRALYYPPLLGKFDRVFYPENIILSNVCDGIGYKHWYFGHYHVDGALTDGKKTALYQKIVCLE